MGLYQIPLSMSLLGFGMGIMLVNFYMCDIMLLLRAHTREECESKRAYVFRCMMFCFSGPCELLVLLPPGCGKCNVISLCFLSWWRCSVR